MQEMSNDQLLMKILRTDAVIAKWEKATKALLKHKDVTNSARLLQITDVVKVLFEQDSDF